MSETALDACAVDLGGTHLIEASAGTGKTFTITTLYLRLVMERGLDVSEILVVTYTKAATAELRDRIRARLRDAVYAMEARLGGRAAPSRGAHSVLATLIDASFERGAPEREHGLLRSALQRFDEAAIHTIHGFCQRVLEENAFESGVDFETEFLADQRRLIEEVARDYWTRELFGAPEPLVRYLSATARNGKPYTPLTLGGLVARVVADPAMPVLPAAIGPLPDLPARCKEWEEAIEAVRGAWRREGADLLALLCTGDLHAATYKVETLVEAWGAELDGLLAAPRPDLAKQAPHFVNLTPGVLELRTKKGRATPEHPFFDRCGVAWETDRRLVEALERHVLALERAAVDYARSEVRARKRRSRTQSFDDLLHDLHAALMRESGEALAERVRQRHRAALIDEFQDTDPSQYAIFRRIWHDDDATLFLIGDPKQAIYAFRGADVFAYLAAKRDVAGAAHTLARNWRSDPALIRAVNRLFERAGTPFVYAGIPFRPASPAPDATDTHVTGEEAGAPLRLLWVEGTADGKARPKKWLRDELPTRIAWDIARKLSGGVRLDGRPLEAGEIAVLCRTNAEARDVQTALRRQRVPAVLQGDASVFDSEEAEELERLLRAITDPWDGALLRAALATRPLGVDALGIDALAAEASVALDEWLERFLSWREIWAEGGAVPLLRRILGDDGGQARLLSLIDGERRITNWLHLAELVQAVAQEQAAGPLAQIGWLHRMRVDDQARGEWGGEEAQIRLESDDRAVQIVTVHKSKGLQYEIVYCPFLWDGTLLRASERDWVGFHDPDDGFVRKLDIGSPEREEHRRTAEIEAMAENMRLLYVALTRARHRLVVVWGPLGSHPTSALGTLLHPPSFDLNEVSEKGLSKRLAEHFRKLGHATMRAQLDEIARASDGAIVVEDLAAIEAARLEVERRATLELESRVFTRRLASGWRTSSFSGLAHASHDAGQGVGVDAGRPTLPPEHPAAEGHDFDSAGEIGRQEGRFDSAAPDSRVASSALVRLHGFPAGPGPGTMIHSIFERIDFEQPAQGDATRAVVEQCLGRFGFAAGHADTLCRAVADVVATPLGGDAGDIGLESVSRDRRIDELEFVFPVVRGAAGAELTPRALAERFARYAEDPVIASYAERVKGLGFAPLEGHLRGFVDLVFRHGERFYVVDYKSNRLGPEVGDYAPERLVAPMCEQHYVLQYHLYLVALHRHLGSRLPGYDYARHMGGVYYLFLRGMAPAHPAGSGIYHDRPPAALIMALSDLFAAAAEGGSP